MIQIQQTIVRAHVHILTRNIIYNVRLVCWEVCMVYYIWAKLSCIYKSTDWQASLLHLEQKEWIGKSASQNLQDLYRVIRNRMRFRARTNQWRYHKRYQPLPAQGIQPDQLWDKNQSRSTSILQKTDWGVSHRQHSFLHPLNPSLHSEQKWSVQR